MTSFAIALEPRAEPRLAAVALGVHLLAAAAPWLARCPVALSVALSLAALGALAATIARLPGRHCRLAGVAWGAAGCHARLAPLGRWQAATPGRGSRAYAGLVALELVVGGRRRGWLLSRQALPAAEFRRLKARIRLSC